MASDPRRVWRGAILLAHAAAPLLAMFGILFVTVGAALGCESGWWFVFGAAAVAAVYAFIVLWLVVAWRWAVSGRPAWSPPVVAAMVVVVAVFAAALVGQGSSDGGDCYS